LRPAPGKENALILDHSGAFYQHGSVTEDQEWSLEHGYQKEDKTQNKKPDHKKPIVCGECFFIYEGQPKCPKCGWAPVKTGKEFIVHEGVLGRIDHNGEFISQKSESPDSRELFLSMLEFRRIQCGFKEGWTKYKYKEKFGEWPPSTGTIKPKRPNVEVQAWLKKLDVAYRLQKKAEKEAREQAREQVSNENKWGFKIEIGEVA